MDTTQAPWAGLLATIAATTDPEAPGSDATEGDVPSALATLAAAAHATTLYAGAGEMRIAETVVLRASRWGVTLELHEPTAATIAALKVAGGAPHADGGVQWLALRPNRQVRIVAFLPADGASHADD